MTFLTTLKSIGPTTDPEYYTPSISVGQLGFAPWSQLSEPGSAAIFPSTLSSSH